jgi:hypothetical protein
MAIPTPQVRIGLDIADESIGSFFTLGDPVKGVLGNSQYVLAGTILFDVTDRVRSITVTRGRSRDFADFPAGEVVVTMNNFDRAFDPVYADSPFFGSIVPRRELRISSNGTDIFRGWVEDWNLFYAKDGESLVDAIASDATIILAKQSLTEFTPTEQTTGERINAVLDRAEVGWSPTLRAIDTGRSTVGTQQVDENTNALEYLQRVAETEPGALFVNRLGQVQFVQRNTSYTSTGLVVFSQDPETGIPYDNLQVIYGSELLYNEVQASREGGGTAIASNIDSQDAYGIRELDISGLLFSTDEQLLDLVVNYAIQYSEPEYRFDGFEVKMNKLAVEDQNKIIQLELGDAVSVSFTPNGIGDPIQRFLEVIRISHTINPEEHIVALGFRAIDYPPFVLGDPLFGRLGTGVLAW